MTNFTVWLPDRYNTKQIRAKLSNIARGLKIAGRSPIGELLAQIAEGRKVVEPGEKTALFNEELERLFQMLEANQGLLRQKQMPEIAVRLEGQVRLVRKLR